ncbi:hypothetical protein FBZ89_109217 [Nitrospirillum amazonense]|uniref:Uncharacterized protein n=1 Tax=Nitrospirillum amazonense TaxID=28077 RepID=A0A560FB34_9PROT|nr:hypothetical protein [Nitrospirillum amazonense]TWB18831.1 hypothetical protein FBZ89_109217 [Nitrospirillum amazonense]
MSATADNQAMEAELDRQLVQGAQRIVTDAVGQRVDQRTMPVGRVPAGMSLVQFWRLDTPLDGVSTRYNDPLVQHLLQDMLSVRRLDPGALYALLTRIKTQLVTAYGPAQGGWMAAMLMSRCRQAIESPEDFPPLLSDDELREAFKTYDRLAKVFHYGDALRQGALGEGTRRKVMQYGRSPVILKDMYTELTKGPAIPIAAMYYFIGYILSTGEKYNAARNLSYRDELNRRNLALP